MPPPPPTSLIAGGGENGFKSPKPSLMGIATLLLITGTAFHAFYWLMAPLAIFLMISYKYVRLQEGKKTSGSEEKAKLKTATTSHMRHSKIVMKIYIAVSSFVVGAWFEGVSVILELFVGINFTYVVVASTPATASSTAAIEAAQKSVEDVDTSFLTHRRSGEEEAKKKNDILTGGKKTASANILDYANGISPKAREDLCIHNPLTMKDVMKPPSKGKVNIILLNHRCRLDWMMLWPMMVRALAGGVTNSETSGINAAAALKIIMKQDMAWIPWLGYCTQIARILFLTRRWETDEETVNTYMRYLASDAEEQSTLLIFPEGTDFFPGAIERSHKYAKDNNRPQFNYVLHPRTTGLLAMKNTIGTDKIESIIDMTIAYADRRKGDRTNDVHLLANLMPKEISFIAERFVFEDNTNFELGAAIPPVRVPTDDLGFKQWVEARWEQKEADMKSYYTRGGSYGWDMQRDIEGQQWKDGKGNSYDRFVVGGNFIHSLYNTPSMVDGATGIVAGTRDKVGSVAFFFKCTVLGGGLFGGNGVTASVWSFVIKPFVVFVLPPIIYGIYLPLFASSWTPFILANVWIVCTTAFFIIYFQKTLKKTFDQAFLYPLLETPQCVLDEEKKRKEASNLPPSATPTSTQKKE